MLKKRIAALIAAVTIVSFSSVTAAAESGEYKGAVILHSDDSHFEPDADNDSFGYAELAAYKARLAEEGYDVMLTDAGGLTAPDTENAAQIVDIMNKSGYDVVIPGEHDFYCGTEQFFGLVENADFSLLSCNFSYIDGDKKQPALVPAAYIEIAGHSVGLIGVCTPRTMVNAGDGTFTDENGEYIYDFCSGNDGQELYDRVQLIVDTVNSQYSPDYLVVLAHLGTDDASAPWSSYQLISNTVGIDVVVDGNSHAVIDGETVKNIAGEGVLLTSCGAGSKYIGAVTIDENGINTELIPVDSYSVTDDTATEEYKTYMRVREHIAGAESETSSDKASPDTGADGVSVAFASALIAMTVLFVCKRRGTV